MQQSLEPLPKTREGIFFVLEHGTHEILLGPIHTFRNSVLLRRVGASLLMVNAFVV